MPQLGSLLILLFHLSAFSEVVSLARLVKAEIVSPHSGILINTGVGNPIVHVGTSPLSKASPEQSRGRLLVFNLFIKRLNTKSPPRDRLGLAFD